MLPSDSRVSIVWLCAAACVGGLLVSAVERAGAFGAPVADALVYSGLITDAAGMPLEGSRSVQLQLWDHESGGTMRCATDTAQELLSAGRFSLPLPAACADAVHASPDLWLELLVEGGSLGRSKLGSVPYALEASHSTSADDAAGALAARLMALETSRVITEGNPSKPLHLCRGTTPVGGTPWHLLGGSQLQLTVDISSCGFSLRPLIMCQLVGLAHHSQTLGGSNPAPPSGGKKDAEAFDVLVTDTTGSVDPVSANADQWHIAWIAIGD
jgi:hypothetical protein